MGSSRVFNFQKISLALIVFSSVGEIVGHPPSPPPSTGIADSYDFIVVGSGPGGSAVAGRLSENGKHSVLLLEAGGLPHPGLDIPALVPYYLVDGQYTKLYYTVPQRNAALSENGTVTYMVGRTLGGGSSVNGMVFNRGSPYDYHQWTQMINDDSWSYRSMMKYFLRIEDYQGDFPSDQHATGGPITISRPKYAPGLKTMYAAGRQLGYPISDTNGPQRPTFAPTEFSKRRGRRVSGFTGYIKPYIHTRKNLKVAGNAIVKRIVFEGKKAVGVIFATNTSAWYGQDHKHYFVQANKEIIVAAGALESPALLMKSGLGHKDILSRNGIPTVKHLPGVGKNLQDHIAVRLEFIINDKSKDEVFIAERELTPENFELYNRTGEGPYSTYDGLHTQALLASSYAISVGNKEWPDIQIEFVSGPGRSDVPGLVGSAHRGLDGGNNDIADWETPVFCIVFLTRPKSKGTINLNPADIDADPLVDPQYLAHEDDMDVLLDGVKRALAVYEKTPAFQRLGARYRRQDMPACDHLQFRSDAYWKCFIRQTTGPGLRGVGTCKMGTHGDSMAVVDTKLKVMGIDGLRVADGSIIPTIVNANTEAPIYAVGEKCADLILQTWEPTHDRDFSGGWTGDNNENGHLARRQWA